VFSKTKLIYLIIFLTLSELCYVLKKCGYQDMSSESFAICYCNNGLFFYLFPLERRHNIQLCYLSCEYTNCKTMALYRKIFYFGPFNLVYLVETWRVSVHSSNPSAIVLKLQFCLPVVLGN
jgi:hypothetical protein